MDALTAFSTRTAEALTPDSTKFRWYTVAFTEPPPVDVAEAVADVASPPAASARAMISPEPAELTVACARTSAVPPPP
ncbi:MAG TPA: hypothetical protein VFY49_18205 [Myxococcota bacterium]|nr:hypothetical protein [Myxococcota bacterium]